MFSFVVFLIKNIIFQFFNFNNHKTTSKKYQKIRRSLFFFFVFLNLEHHLKFSTFSMIFTFYLQHFDIFRFNLETFPHQVSNILVQKEFLHLFSHFEKFRRVAPKQMFGLFQALTKNSSFH
jgi:hypothetical protein